MFGRGARKWSREGEGREEESQQRMHSEVEYHCGQEGCLSAGPSVLRLCRSQLGGPTRERRELGYVSPNAHPSLTKAAPRVGLRTFAASLLTHLAGEQSRYPVCT